MGATTAPEGCTGTASESADHCIEQADVTCPNPDGTSFRMAGRVTINAAATAGDAIYDMTVRNANGTVQCHSTYDIQYTKQ